MISRFRLIRFGSRVHTWVYNYSRGLIGGHLGKVEILFLTTTGRKTGRMRVVPLAAIPYEGCYIVIPSFGGSPIPPQWLSNVQHNPNVHIKIQNKDLKARASVIGLTNKMYADMWASATKVYSGFDTYKSMTIRPIPVVKIELA